MPSDFRPLSHVPDYADKPVRREPAPTLDTSIPIQEAEAPIVVVPARVKAEPTARVPFTPQAAHVEAPLSTLVGSTLNMVTANHPIRNAVSGAELLDMLNGLYGALGFLMAQAGLGTSLNPGSVNAFAAILKMLTWNTILLRDSEVARAVLGAFTVQMGTNERMAFSSQANSAWSELMNPDTSGVPARRYSPTRQTSWPGVVVPVLTAIIMKANYLSGIPEPERAERLRVLVRQIAQMALTPPPIFNREERLIAYS